MKFYNVTEMFASMQGEGANAGRPAVFLRLAGCNLACPWCDTEHDLHGVMTAADLVDSKWWGRTSHRELLIVTGGEPFLQLDRELLLMLCHHYGEVAIESNGTLDVSVLDGLPSDIWLTVSPKWDATLHPSVWQRANEVKVVDTGEWDSRDLLVLAERFDRATSFLVQPLDNGEQSAGTFPSTTERAWELVRKAGSPWRLGVQLHKVLGMR